MQVFLIPPVVNESDLAYVKKGNGAMVLAQFVLKYPDYAKFYRKLKMFKTIDNGACEGSLCDIEQVLYAAELIKADEVILPDILFDGKKTIESAEEALKVIRKKKLLKRYKWMVAIQGKTAEEYWDCLNYFNRHDYINTIGFSKLSCPLAFGMSIMDARLHITNAMVKLGVVSSKKEYHLLGGSHEILTEVMLHPSFIRSVDTSAPFEYAKAGKLLHNAKADLKGKAKLEEPLKEADLELVEKNINELLQRAAV